LKIAKYQDIIAEPVTTEGAEGVTIRWLIAKQDGAENFAMRFFEISQEGQTPLHTHDFEHEVFVVGGKGVVWREGKEIALEAGSFIFVPEGEKHCFKNTGHEMLKFICIIPV